MVSKNWDDSQIHVEVTESDYNQAWYRVKSEFSQEYGTRIGPNNMVELTLIERYDPHDIHAVARKWREKGVPDKYIKMLKDLIDKTEKLALKLAKRRRAKPEDAYFEIENVYGVSGTIVNYPGIGICVRSAPSTSFLTRFLKEFVSKHKLEKVDKEDNIFSEKNLRMFTQEYLEKYASLKRISPYWIVELREYHDPALNERFLELVLADRHGQEYRFVDRPDQLISKLQNELFARQKMAEVLTFAIDELRSDEYRQRGIYKKITRPAGFGFFYEQKYDLIKFLPPLGIDYSTNFLEFELKLPQSFRKLELKRSLKLLNDYIRSFPNPTKARIILYYMTVAPLGFVRLQMSRMRYHLLCYGASGSGKTTTIRNMSKFIWGFYGKMSGSTAESSYQRAKTFSCTTFPILIDEAESVFQNLTFIDELKSSATDITDRRRQTSNYVRYATPVFTSNKDVLTMRHIDYATKKRFLIIPFSKKEVISYQAEKKFTSELLPKLMDHVGWIGAYLKHFFITSWREYKKQFLGDLSEFLEFGRTALINAYEFVELPLPDWIKEPVDLGEIKEEEEPVSMLAWRTIVEDVNNKARAHKDLLTLPFMDRLQVLAERDDLPVYLSTDGQVVYITRGFKKRLEELHDIKLDYSLSDLAEEMGINHGRKMVKGKKLTVLWATFEQISEKIKELSVEMSKMSDQKTIGGKDENEHGQSGHFDENVQNVHEEKSIDGKDEDGGQSGHLEKEHYQKISGLTALNRKRLEGSLMRFIEEKGEAEYTTIFRKFDRYYPREVIEDVLNRLMEMGLIFEPHPGVLKTVE